MASQLVGADLSNGTGDRGEMVASVLQKDIPWDGYQRAGLISIQELELIRKYDKKPDEIKKQILAQEGPAYAELFLTFVSKMSNLDSLLYVLILIHELLHADGKRVELFAKLATPGHPYQPFLRLIINRTEKDFYITKMACSILGILMSKAQQVPREHFDVLLGWILEQLRKPATPEAGIAVSTLQSIVTKDEYRVFFFKANGLPLLVNIVSTQVLNLHLLYETTYVIWLMSYNKTIASNLVDTGLVKSLVDIIKAVTKEKVVRLAIASLRNLVDIETNNEDMLDAGLIRMLAILGNKKWADEDIIDDLKVLNEALAKNIVILSSFDMYKKEVTSGVLEWSPVHKSEKFWRENVTRFEENDYQILIVLQKVLQNTNSSPVSLSVAAYDLGEFVRFHPRGKIIIQQLGIKLDLMKLMTHDDAEVKKQALFAVQKAMVTNWEYLTK